MVPLGVAKVRILCQIDSKTCFFQYIRKGLTPPSTILMIVLQKASAQAKPCYTDRPCMCLDAAATAAALAKLGYWLCCLITASCYISQHRRRRAVPVVCSSVVFPNMPGRE